MLSMFGNLYPLIIDFDKTGGTGIMNPSILLVDDCLLCNIRHTNYTLFHSEKKLFHHQYGPLQYIHPENDLKLKTQNILCNLDYKNNYNIIKYDIIDTSNLDREPLWDFLGLEDGRLVNWEDKIYLTGVRRDTTTDGQGRMELSELDVNNTLETNRFRIPTPFDIDSYCEKNWMPVLDQPFTYIKWSNPTEVVKYNIKDNTTNQIKLSNNYYSDYPDFRGGSQVIPIKYQNNKYYLAVTHEVCLFNSELGRKDGRYKHRFLVWDEDLNLIKISSNFSFMNGEIEFCCGITILNNNLLITFGFQDNAAYLLEIEYEIIENLLWKI